MANKRDSKVLEEALQDRRPGDSAFYNGDYDDDFLAGLDSPQGIQSAIEAITENGLNLGAVKVMKMGIEFTGELSFDRWQNLAKVVRAIDIATPWFYGDLVNYALSDKSYGEKGDVVAWLSSLTGYSVGTLNNLASVAGKIKISSRDENLSAYMAYQLLRAISAKGKSFEYWLGFVRERGYSVRDMEAYIDDKDLSKPPMKAFNTKWRTFSKKTNAIVKDASDEERREIAKKLYNLARRIERGTTE